MPNFALRGYSGPMEEIKPEIPDMNRADDGRYGVSAAWLSSSRWAVGTKSRHPSKSCFISHDSGWVTAQRSRS